MLSSFRSPPLAVPRLCSAHVVPGYDTRGADEYAEAKVIVAMTPAVCRGCAGRYRYEASGVGPGNCNRRAGARARASGNSRR